MQKVSYKNFKGHIEEIEPNRHACFGEVAVLDEENLEITELPIKTWTQVRLKQIYSLLMLFSPGFC